MANAVKTASNTDVATFDYGTDAGSGFENQTSADYSIPFIGVLQAMSPQVKPEDEGGLPNARPGMLINTVTEELYEGKKGMEFIPALTEHVFVEWVPRDLGGGFVAVHQIDSQVVSDAKKAAKDFGKYRTPAGNDLIETFYVYGIVTQDDEPGEMAVIAFTSTKIKVYKKFNTKIGMFQIKTPSGQKVRPPLFAHRVKLTVTKEKNNKGEFYNFDLNPANGTLAESLLPPNDPRLEAARSCKEMVEQGQARASHETQNATGGAAAEGGAGEDAPF